MRKIIGLATLWMPTIVMAATALDVLNTIIDIVQLIVPLLMTIALIYFIWGVIKFVIIAKGEEEKKQAKDIIMYGIIGLFSIMAIWGIVALIKNTFGVTETEIEPPQYNFFR